jgi:hypothetical protein
VLIGADQRQCCDVAVGHGAHGRGPEGEPYRPLLDAFDELARSDNGAEVVALMERLAPMWLVQLPS